MSGTMLEHLAKLEAAAADEEALRQEMAHLLHRTAIALRGPEPEGVSWTWSDLPERVAAIVEAARATRVARSTNSYAADYNEGDSK